jgi:hypothetical protein
LLRRRNPARQMGEWVATADSRQGGAFGDGYFLTDVNLKGPSSLVSTRVLEFSHEQPAMRLMIEWTTPKHLIVKYGNADLVSQVNECGGRHYRGKSTERSQMAHEGAIDIATTRQPFRSAITRTVTVSGWRPEVSRRRNAPSVSGGDGT